MGEGAGHPDPEMRRGAALKNFFPPIGPQFSPKIRGSRPPGPSPGSAADTGKLLVSRKAFGYSMNTIMCDSTL